MPTILSGAQLEIMPRELGARIVLIVSTGLPMGKLSFFATAVKCLFNPFERFKPPWRIAKARRFARY